MEELTKYRVVVSERAARMLVSQSAFLAQVSPEAADRLVASFEKTAESLEDMPNRGNPIAIELIPNVEYRSIMFEKRYRLIYKIADNTVYVEYVVDCRQDYQWLFYE